MEFLKTKTQFHTHLVSQLTFSYGNLFLNFEKIQVLLLHLEANN